MTGRTFSEATIGELTEISGLLNRFDREYLNMLNAWIEGKWDWAPGATTRSVIDQWYEFITEYGGLQMGVFAHRPDWENW